MSLQNSAYTHSEGLPTLAPVSVITTCYGRNRHLYNLLASLANGQQRPAEVIIVNDDADPEQLKRYPLAIKQIATNKAQADDVNNVDKQENGDSQDNVASTGFDIGRNRNLGAKHASHDALIFLDVDCVVAPDFIAQMTQKLHAMPHALIMGQPRYLTRPLTAQEAKQLADNQLATSFLDELSLFNPYRPKVDVPLLRTQDYGAFWSLCFAINRQQFDSIGGFDTSYVGYGAEDTDFAFKARQLGIEFYLTDDVIYHQQHGIYRPPLNHVDSIVINANRFYQKWQHWAMGGWLAEFAKMGLIDWQHSQTHPISILRAPTSAEIKQAHCPDAPFV